MQLLVRSSSHEVLLAIQQQPEAWVEDISQVGVVLGCCCGCIRMCVCLCVCILCIWRCLGCICVCSRTWVDILQSMPDASDDNSHHDHHTDLAHMMPAGHAVLRRVEPPDAAAAPRQAAAAPAGRAPGAAAVECGAAGAAPAPCASAGASAAPQVQAQVSVA